MASNLDKLFKNDSELETEGIWLEIAEGVAFKVRRFGGSNSMKVKSAMAKYYKPYARLIEMGSLSQEKEKEVTTKVFVETCLVDWKGIEIDGKLTAFEKEVALKFFSELPELLDTVVAYATDSKNYRVELGNS